MSELSQAINEMRDMRESYDQLAGAALAYNEGKPALAQAITSKGVPTASSDSLATMAENVINIQQSTTEIDGGEMYGAQLFGDADPAQSPLWNLYEVLAQMKSQYIGSGQYEALIVCEYYKGYDSLQLQGADAYYTCDGDFYNTSSPNHVWHDSDNGRANRWVCFLFATSGARLDITNTAISPRSMYIGGHIGTIEYFVAGRLTELVCGVEDTDILDNFLDKGYAQSFNFNCILRGVKNFATPSYEGDALVVNSGGSVIIDGLNENITARSVFINARSAQYLFIRGCKTLGLYGDGGYIGFGGTIVVLAGVEEMHGYLRSGAGSNAQVIDASDLKILSGTSYFAIPWGGTFSNLIDVRVGKMTTNFPNPFWDPTNVLADATKKAQLVDNIKNHILARVSDATGGTQLVFTVGTNMYNAIASENITWNDQTMTLADAFLTKNWLFAGA